MAYCIECGIKLPEEAKFCPSCGTPQKKELFKESDAHIDDPTKTEKSEPTQEVSNTGKEAPTVKKVVVSARPRPVVKPADKETAKTEPDVQPKVVEEINIDKRQEFSATILNFAVFSINYDTKT